MRKESTDPREAMNVQMDHYIGIDVGTGSARACIISDTGEIVGLASENIGLWQPQQGYYVRIPESPGLDLTSPPCTDRFRRSNPPPTYGTASAPLYSGR